MGNEKKKMYAQVGVHLMDVDLIDAGEELAAKRIEANEVEAAKAKRRGEFHETDEYKAFKEEMDGLTAKAVTLEQEIDALAQQIDTREKIVDVEVREEADLARNMIVTVRVGGKEDGQIVGKPRPMTLNELAEARQGQLDLETRELSDGEIEQTRDTDAPPPADVDAGEEEQLGKEQELVKTERNKRKGRKGAMVVTAETPGPEIEDAF